MYKPEFETILQKFEIHKVTIPPEMRSKLQIMAQHIQNKSIPFEQLSDEDQTLYKDIYQLSPQSLKLVFVSIVTSILDPRLYSSFQKNCKISVMTKNLLSSQKYKWSRAYIDFGDQFLYFNKVNETLKFGIKGLSIKMVEDESVQNNNMKSSKRKISLIYNNKTKAIIKFQRENAAMSSYARISQLIQTKQQNQKDQPLSNKPSHDLPSSFTNVSEDINYTAINKHKNICFYIHKKQPKLFIQIFLKTEKLSESQLIQFLIMQKLWNSKVRSEKIKKIDGLFENFDVVVQRKYKPYSIMSYERKSYTGISVSIQNQLKQQKHQKYGFRNNNPKFIITEQDISERMISDKSKKSLGQSLMLTSIVNCHLSVTITLEVLSEKYYKVIFLIDYDGKGNFKSSENRNALIYMFSDAVFMQEKIQKLSKKEFPETKQISSAFYNKISDIKTTIQMKQTQLIKQANSMYENQSIRYTDNPQIQDRMMNQFIEHEKQQGVEDQNFEIMHSHTTNIDQEDIFYDLDSWSSPSESDEDNKNQQEHINLSKQQQIHKNNGLNKSNKSNKSNKGIQQKYARKSSLMSQFPNQKMTPDKADELVSKYRPLVYKKEVTMAYFRIIKQKVYEMSYLHKRFAQQAKQQFDQTTPWYSPSLITKCGKQYTVTSSKELIFINQPLINSQKQSLKFIIKQVGANIIKGKSVMNVSLPVDIFEDRSILQRSAASFGCAPRFLKGKGEKDSFQQMKAVVSLAFSVPPMELIMQKPFNPLLGQTFTAYLGGIQISYEQISHHPPISSYYMQSEDFIIYGSLIAVADVGLNSGYGRNSGAMNVIMKNGTHFEIYFPPAEISGLIFGTRKYRIYQKSYVIDKKNQIFAQLSPSKESKGLYECKSKEKLRLGDLIGGIFQVTPAFLESLSSIDMKKFSGIKKQDIINKLAHLQGVWFEDLYIDDQNVTQGCRCFPVQYSEVCLPSDSNYRLDIMFHRIGDLARSQIEKQILQNQQRQDKKFRLKYKQQK